jgi:hypothetical protein
VQAILTSAVLRSKHNIVIIIITTTTTTIIIIYYSLLASTQIQKSNYYYYYYLKVLRFMKSAEDCKLLRSGIASVQKWCIENYMKINIFKQIFILFVKENCIHINYFIGDLLIVRTDSVIDIGLC